MATTVIAAFNEFMKDTVNLKKADTDDARASRDWLIGKMNDFEGNDSNLLIVFYVQIMPDDFVMQLHRF